MTKISKEIFGKRRKNQWKKVLPNLQEIRKADKDNGTKLLSRCNTKTFDGIASCIKNLLVNKTATTNEQKEYIQKYVSRVQGDLAKLAFMHLSHRTRQQKCSKMFEYIKVILDMMVPCVEYYLK